MDKIKNIFVTISAISVIILLGIFVFTANVLAGGKNHKSGHDTHMNQNNYYESSFYDFYDREDSWLFSNTPGIYGNILGGLGYGGLGFSPTVYGGGLGGEQA